MAVTKDISAKLKCITYKAINKQDYEKALAAIKACANIFYLHNQTYADDELEDMLTIISHNIFVNIPYEDRSIPTISKCKTILFYDGFGLDTRGLALIFLKGLVRCGYQVVYVTKKSAKNTQPTIDRAVYGYNFKRVYVETNHKYLIWIKELSSAFEEYKPQVAFFYTTPFDVAATVVFNHYEGSAIRYLIDLTDHAYWLGRNACDYFIEMRDVGSKISFNYRKLTEDRLLMLPYYAAIDFQMEFEGFPFELNGKRVIFSGGALYKTLGDKDNKYYKIVEKILCRHRDIIFLYAGYGDDSLLKGLIERYPNRVYHICERRDLYQIMQRSVLYLNTYPMFGGLMMNYAASAGTIPLTLKHNHDSDGLLFNQSNLGIEYDNMDELLSDVDRLLDNEEYLRLREEKLKGCVITEELFENNLISLIETGKTDFSIYTDYIDTQEFRNEYDKRFNYKEAVRTSVASWINRSLLLSFPIQFIIWIYKYIFK